MIELRRADSHGESTFRGVSSIHHFCFGPYQSTARADWGRLRMLNRHDIAPDGRRDAHFLAGMTVLLMVERGAIEAQSGDRRARVGEGEAALLTMGSGADYGFAANSACAKITEIWLRDYPPTGSPAIRQFKMPIGAIGRPETADDCDVTALTKSRIRTVCWRSPDSAPCSIDIEGYAYLTLLDGQADVGPFDLKRNDSLAADEPLKLHVEPRGWGLLLIIDRLSAC